MAFETVSYEELRQSLASWTLRFKRGVPLPGSAQADEFTDSFAIPETEFEYTQSYIDQNNEIIALFKTAVCLRAWQTRSGKESAVFEYYKITKAVMDDDGKIIDYILTGYVVV